MNSVKTTAHPNKHLTTAHPVTGKRGKPRKHG